MQLLAHLGRCCFGAAVAGSGLMQVINADFVRLIPKLPAWAPPSPALAMATGVLLVVLGVALLAGYGVRFAGAAVASLLLVSFVIQRIPELAPNPGAVVNPAKVLAIVGGAWLLAVGGARGGWVAPALFALFFVICGWAHFVYAGFVDTLVPAWIPPNARFWTCFSAVALLLGGAGVLVPRARRTAAVWSGIMVFLWVWMLHVPRAISLRTAFELAGVFEALAIAGVAFLIASEARAVVKSPTPGVSVSEASVRT